MKALLRKILLRAREPSTWAGLAAVLGGQAVGGLTEVQWVEILGMIMSIAGVIAMFVSDPGHIEE